jgi:hypothetical protein
MHLCAMLPCFLTLPACNHWVLQENLSISFCAATKIWLKLDAEKRSMEVRINTVCLQGMAYTCAVPDASMHVRVADSFLLIKSMIEDNVYSVTQ